MNRVLKSCVLALPIVALCASPALADVKTRDKTQVKFEGFLGRMMGMFGGKAAKEGIVVTNAVKGDRKSELNDSNGRIVDLKEEKVYQLDVKKKTYEVVTFEELRRQLREAQEKAEKEAKNAPKEERDPQQEKPAREMEVDFDVKETGQKKQIAGYDTREVVMTITVREKGKTLEDGGGVVMTVDSWMGPQIAALKELTDFDIKYWKALQGTEAMGLSAEQLAAVMAMYPLMKPAMERMQKEAPKLQGTPLASTTTVEGVKSKEAAAQQQSSETPKSVGGLGGLIARKMAKKDDSASGNRATIFTAEHETQEIQTSVAADDVAIPAGFKQK